MAKLDSGRERGDKLGPLLIVAGGAAAVFFFFTRKASGNGGGGDLRSLATTATDKPLDAAGQRGRRRYPSYECGNPHESRTY